jgi:Outer membrane protein and related peptidoglycan-associated (lipo)proteins
VIWHGSEKPIADNNSPFGRQLNRRIDVRLIGTSNQEFGQFYLVRPGATVSALVSSMNISDQELRKLNGLSGDLEAYKPIRITEQVDPNYELLVPADIESDSDFVYFVKQGENLQSVSQKFNVPEEVILEQNGLSSPTLTPGQRLIIYKKN